MSTKKAYKNPPSPKLLEKIGATNLTLADAIAEVVANSFDASVDSEKTVVDVTVQSDQILVIDNGIGMPESVLVEAVKLGVDMSDVVAKKASTKGKFGLGMKTACASMGRWWAVYTRPLGEQNEYRVVFDLAEWEKRADSPDAWTIYIEELAPDLSGPLGDRPHGTAVIVKKLRTKDPMAGAVIKKLGESFKPHLEQGDVILINGNKAKPYVYTFVPGTKVPIDIQFGPSNQYRIKGWVAIDRQTHNDGQYGFNIYRYGQLVQTWHQGWFRAHLMTSRIIGEVEMDFIDATFFKLGLQDSEVWRMAQAEMKEFMKPITRASSNLSKKGNINVPAKRNEIVGEMRNSLGLPTSAMEAGTEEEESKGDNSSDEPDNNNNGGTKTSRTPIKLQVEAEQVVLEDGTSISISSLETSLGLNGPPFDYIDDNEAPIELQAIINTDHPLYNRSKDRSQLQRLAVADSILRYLVDRCGIESRRAVEIRNAWLLKVLEGSKGGAL
jgi:hypothetical protein